MNQNKLKSAAQNFIIAFAFFAAGILLNQFYNLLLPCKQHTTTGKTNKVLRLHYVKHTKIPVTITVYNATVGQCDNSPLNTADGSLINPKRPQRWCGVSRDLLKIFGYGAKINIDIPDAPYLSGLWTIHDTGKATSKMHVDLLISNPDVCFVRGKWKGFVVL